MNSPSGVGSRRSSKTLFRVGQLVNDLYTALSECLWFGENIPLLLKTIFCSFTLPWIFHLFRSTTISSHFILFIHSNFTDFWLCVRQYINILYSLCLFLVSLVLFFTLSRALSLSHTHIHSFTLPSFILL